MILNKSILFFTVFCACVTPIFTQKFSRRPTPIFRENMPELILPSNASLIRENIVDTFSCENRIYGYYADIENDCQIFHVCMPQNRGSRRWSFICPTETVFNQATFVCTRINESIPCEESEQFYILNEEIGKEEPEPENETNEVEENPSSQEPSYAPENGYTNELPSVTSFSRRNPRPRVLRRRGKNSRFDTTQPNVISTTPLNF